MLKINPIFFLFLLGFCSITCKKDVDERTTVSVKVLDATSSSPQNPRATISPNSLVRLFLTEADIINDKDVYNGITGKDGICNIKVPFRDRYFVTATNGAASCFKDGYLIVGVFSSQAEVNAPPVQTPVAKVGGLRFRDVDGDGAITPLDKQTYQSIQISNSFQKSVIDSIYISR